LNSVQQIRSYSIFTDPAFNAARSAVVVVVILANSNVSNASNVGDVTEHQVGIVVDCPLKFFFIGLLRCVIVNITVV